MMCPTFRTHLFFRFLTARPPTTNGDGKDDLSPADRSAMGTPRMTFRQLIRITLAHKSLQCGWGYVGL
ncbi:hypothetical protein [Prevotella corporis]|uniref:hypothetical protein n=1 Tax=Prevotella corporis TaxID=28128 RepID=UPI0023F0BF82|nr:hypothetical protein [Prevotella corporis]